MVFLKILTIVAAALCVATPAFANSPSPDPIGMLIGKVAAGGQAILKTVGLRATLYHEGHGVGPRDSLGCKVIPMRTAAVDGVKVPRHTILFIPQTVGMRMPDGSRHDGYWYATDTGGAIHEGRIDLFTGAGAGSMKPLMPLNLATITVELVGKFSGCPTG